ncbi:hypothetical protein PMAYCL1PPCAC_22852, partial [Pristionchus mayeri]
TETQYERRLSDASGSMDAIHMENEDVRKDDFGDPRIGTFRSLAEDEDYHRQSMGNSHQWPCEQETVPWRLIPVDGVILP